MPLSAIQHTVNSRAVDTVTIQPGQVWQHFKGGLYEVVGVARNSETLADMVIYKDLYGIGQLWARPLDMWLETIQRGAYSGPPIQIRERSMMWPISNGGTYGRNQHDIR